MRRDRKIIRLAGILLLLLLLAACAQAPAAREIRAKEPMKIAIIPFETETSDRHKDQVVTCSVCGSTYRTGKVEPVAEANLTAMLFDMLRGVPGVVQITPAQAKKLWSANSSQATRASHIRLLQDIGQELGADAVLYGKIFRYEEREGRWYSVQRPASVAFDLHLVRSKDGAILWKDRFDETQKSLTENLFDISSYIKRGIRWLTADELARDGMEEMLKTFPY